ncbi:MAG: sensor histidine kinase [Ilumatobacter sp.]
MEPIDATAARRPGPIKWLRTHPRQADGLLAVLLTTLSLTFHLLDFDDSGDFVDPSWWTAIVVFASVFPIAWRRTAPIASIWVVVTAFLIAGFADVDGSGFLGVLVAYYSLGAHATGPERRRTLIITTTAIALLFVVGLIASEFDLGSFVSSTVVLVTAYVLGDNLRQRREAADALLERLERAERERDLLAQQRVTDERTRIAREFHDVVAHSVTAMVIQAAAARRSIERSPSDAAAALDQVESTGRSAINELRSILGVLRRDVDDELCDGRGLRVPQPSLTRLDDLLMASSDLPIHLRTNGLDELGRVDAGTDLTAFRLIQEGLTNVRRHGVDVTRVDVEVELGAATLDIVVRDNGRSSSARPNGDGGYGLVGMRERVEAVGGSLDAGPAEPGWRLLTRLPLDRSRSRSTDRPAERRAGDAVPVGDER